MKTAKALKPAGHESVRGSLAELPGIFWMLMVLITLPAIDLATLLYRYTFVVEAAGNACRVAAVAKTFSADLSPAALSATHVARNQAASTLSKFSHVRVDEVTTYLVVTELASGRVTHLTTALTNAADTATNLYEIQVNCRAQVDPLITLDLPLLQNIPGLSAPMLLTASCKRFAECPQGLNQ